MFCSCTTQNKKGKSNRQPYGTGYALDTTAIERITGIREKAMQANTK
jgi:hypothetical protein